MILIHLIWVGGGGAKCGVKYVTQHSASLPRCLAASLPRCLAASLPRCHAASLPRCHASSIAVETRSFLS